MAATTAGCSSNRGFDRGGSGGEETPAPPAAAPDPGPEKKTGNPELVAVPEELAGRVTLERVVRGLKRPLGLEFAPDTGTLYVVLQGGKILPLNDGKVGPPMLDLSRRVSRGHNEQGLLGLAFDPAFADSHTIYVNFTDRKGNTQVSSFKVGADGVADPGSERVLFRLKQPYGNHNGGDIEFGPDGKLYIGTGDGGAAGDPLRAGQDRNNQLAKMLRLDPARPDQVEVVMIGLRNPWRYHFDPKTSDLYIGDVGQDKWEEVHVLARADIDGANLGWSIMEGNHCFRPKKDCDPGSSVKAVVEYDHNVGCSVTGGQVYRGSAISGLEGQYFYSDYCTAIVRSFRWNADIGIHDHWDWKPVLDPRFRLAEVAAFGADKSGELYIVSTTGTIDKIVAKDGIP